jgi:UDP-glucose 4-epimerase
MLALENRPVLVTGGAGFVGSHLAEELVRLGARVTVADNLSSGTPSNLTPILDRVTLKKLDLAVADLQPLLEEGQFEFIFHLAGNANIQDAVTRPGRDFERNTVATVNLLESARQLSLQSQIVYASSAYIYGEGRNAPITERDPAIPVSPYGVSKLAAEQYLRLYHSLYGLRTTILRMFSIYGPRLRKQVIYDLMCKIRDNPRELPVHGDGTQERDFNYIRNVIDAMLLLAEKASFTADVYNLGGAETVNIRCVAEMLCEAMGVSPKLVFSGVVRPGETQRWVADISRIRTLGYTPRVTLKEGLAETVRWFQQSS